MEGAALFKANEFLWKENQRLREENRLLREQLQKREESGQHLAQLQERCAALSSHNARLRKQVAELRVRLSAPPQPQAPLPPFIKPNRQSRRRKRPGRREGHAPALRPPPQKIDQHQDVPLPMDERGQVSCPHCKTQLSDVRHHDCLVEDLITAKTITICYHTASGYCPCCRKRIESRAPEQPPAAAQAAGAGLGGGLCR
jgi:hypothetical protein